MYTTTRGFIGNAISLRVNGSSVGALNNFHMLKASPQMWREIKSRPQKKYADSFNNITYCYLGSAGRFVMNIHLTYET